MKWGWLSKQRGRHSSCGEILNMDRRLHFVFALVISLWPCLAAEESKACFGSPGQSCTEHTLTCSNGLIAIQEAFYMNNTACPGVGRNCGNISVSNITLDGPKYDFNDTELDSLYGNCSTESTCTFPTGRTSINGTLYALSVIRYQCIYDTSNICDVEAIDHNEKSLLWNKTSHMEEGYTCSCRISSNNTEPTDVYALDIRPRSACTNLSITEDYETYKNCNQNKRYQLLANNTWTIILEPVDVFDILWINIQGNFEVNCITSITSTTPTPTSTTASTLATTSTSTSTTTTTSTTASTSATTSTSTTASTLATTSTSTSTTTTTSTTASTSATTSTPTSTSTTTTTTTTTPTPTPTSTTTSTPTSTTTTTTASTTSTSTTSTSTTSTSTTSTSSSTSTTAQNTGAIAGGVIGVLVVCALVAAVLIWFKFVRIKKAEKGNDSCALSSASITVLQHGGSKKTTSNYENATLHGNNNPVARAQNDYALVGIPSTQNGTSDLMEDDYNHITHNPPQSAPSYEYDTTASAAAAVKTLNNTSSYSVDEDDYNHLGEGKPSVNSSDYDTTVSASKAVEQFGEMKDSEDDYDHFKRSEDRVIDSPYDIANHHSSVSADTTISPYDLAQ